MSFSVASKACLIEYHTFLCFVHGMDKLEIVCKRSITKKLMIWSCEAIFITSRGSWSLLFPRLPPWQLIFIVFIVAIVPWQLLVVRVFNHLSINDFVGVCTAISAALAIPGQSNVDLSPIDLQDQLLDPIIGCYQLNDARFLLSLNAYWHCRSWDGRTTVNRWKGRRLGIDNPQHNWISPQSRCAGHVLAQVPLGSVQERSNRFWLR